MPAAQRRVPRSTPEPEATPAPAPRRMNPAAARAREEASKPIKQETGRMSTNSSAYGKDETQEEQLETRKFPPGVEPAFVRVGAGKTLNLGNYESLRIDVSITMPCLPSEVDAVFEDISEAVADKLLDEEATWLGSAKPKAKRK